MTLLYTVPQQEAFGLSIAIYFYLTGLSAGSFIISTLAYGFGFEKYKPVGKVGVVLATLLLVAAPMFLLLHSGRPLRAWHLFVYIHGTSPISWGSFLLTLYPSTASSTATSCSGATPGSPRRSASSASPWR